MGLISKTVEVTLNARNCKYYEDLGYKIPREFDNKGRLRVPRGTKILVKVEDLSKGSHVRVECKCDYCGEKLNWEYKAYNVQVHEKGETYCQKCGNALLGIKKTKETRFKNGKSLYFWCIENNRQDILDRWDYELNKDTPKDILYSTHEKRWFKCLDHLEHHSELKNINSITNINRGSNLFCKQCNTIAQYILDNFPNKKLEEVWDYEKNGDLDPWEIDRCSRIKVWIICQEKEYHGSYEICCNNFTSQHQRCCFCSGKKIHPKDSLGQYVISNFGEEFLWKVWSGKNEVSPFEVAPRSNKKVWWNCLSGKHKPFKRDCDSSVEYEFRCPKCVEEKEESIIEEKTRLYLEELGYEVRTEHNCSIKPINPKTKQPFLFDNEIILSNGKHLIIEVHGQQHYSLCLYNNTKEKLHYQQVKDRYKRIKCIQAGYEYLELPYWTFYKNNRYKKLIDNKIKEILDK